MRANAIPSQSTAPDRARPTTVRSFRQRAAHHVRSILWELFHALPLVVVQPRGCRAVHGSLTGRSRRVWTSYPKAYRVGIATVSRRCCVQQR